MRLRKGLILGVCSSVLFAGSTMAADIIPIVIPPIVPPDPEPRCEIDGYVEAFGGYVFGTEVELEELTQGPPVVVTTEDYVGLGFGGAGRASLSCSPNFSIQLDAWGEHWSGQWDDGFEDGDWEDTWVGVGTHLTFRGANFFAGPLASIGAVAGWGTFANFGVEAGFSSPMFRIQAQGGYTMALFGDAATDDVTDWYVQGVVAFYPTPHFSITGNVGYDVYTDNTPWIEGTLNWGARLEFQPPAIPVSFFVGYQGWWWNGTDGGVLFETGIEHSFGAGIRFLVGEPDLRSLDDKVPLMDYNAIYRQTFIH